MVLVRLSSTSVVPCLVAGALAPGTVLLAAACTVVESPGGVTDEASAAAPDASLEAKMPGFVEALDPGPEADPASDPQEGDEVEAPQPLKAAWEPCASNKECESGFCAPDQGRKVCTEVCLETCPDGWTCEPVVFPGGEPLWVCTSRFWALCRPCVADADCREGVLAESCVVLGPDGRFCGAACTVDGDCPANYVCKESTSTSGVVSKQCVPRSGTCECTPLYAKAGLAAGCEKSGTAGTCPGRRVCGPDGVLGPCDAPEPAPETCNGKDDDCDGTVDESLTQCCQCGDGKCQAFCEDVTTCCTDCHECGNDRCECGESFATCELDCCGTCGDGKCARYEKDGRAHCTETETSCPADCHPAACGNGTCEGSESVEQCPADCKKGECGNHVCEPVDGGPAGCPEDCAATCGNCWCEGTESSFDCPGDCGTCGDGFCSPCAPLGEDLGSCWKDCCVPSPAGEACGNHADDDCDGEVDEDGASGCAERFRDIDQDGWGWTADHRCLCEPGVPYTAVKPGDCNDADAAVSPVAVEACNGKDDDCDAATDGAGSAGCVDWWRDEDGDGFGVNGDSKCLCAGAPPYVAVKAGDCQDNDPAASPAAVEACNGKDDDCDGALDPEGAPGCVPWYRDGDRDGSGVTGDSRCLCAAEAPWDAPAAGDCDDAEADVRPGAEEVCNGLDDNCDGVKDPEDSPGCGVLYRDADSDGWGNAFDWRCLCAPAGQYAATAGGDCAEADPAVHPGAPEGCNAMDDDCDGVTDPEGSGGCEALWTDGDKDGWGVGASKCLCGPTGAFRAPRTGDCDDGVSDVNPAATESCNGRDDNCDAGVDEQGASGCTNYWSDADGDGHGVGSAKCLCGPSGLYRALASGDCCDSDGNAKPGQGAWFTSANACGSWDFNCDGTVTKRYTRKLGVPFCDASCVASEQPYHDQEHACGEVQYIVVCTYTTYCKDGQIQSIQSCH